MSDLDLLELAAKAADYDVMRTISGRIVVDFKVWDPLNDDGDAFRLALELKINIEYVQEMDSVMCTLPGSMGATSVAAIGDVELRLAIVQAAAALGRSMS